jgi:putative membrane protein insertion efficiency factor
MIRKTNQISNGVKQIILKFIRFYQKFISPNLGSNCRFFPSCSNYTYQAIVKYGLFKGFKKGIWRILRCNPLSKGGIDLP